MRRLVSLAFVIICIATAGAVRAEALTDPAHLARAMPAMAMHALSTYTEPDKVSYLTHLAALQLASGEYQKANATIASLRTVLAAGKDAHANVRYAEYEIYARAKDSQTKEHGSFPDAFRRAFRREFASLTDTDAVRVGARLTLPRDQAESDLQEQLTSLKGKSRLTPGDIAELAVKYIPYELATDVAMLAPALVREDGERRYVIDDDVRIRTKDGATISAVTVRKRGIATRQPAALVFTIYAQPGDDVQRAEYAAARGYAGVTAYTRGKAHSPGAVVPYEDDGRDATAVIDWISKQPWSDGSVGMYGGSYSGFAQWAAAKYMHPALKTIVPYVANNRQRIADGKQHLPFRQLRVALLHHRQ